MHKTVSLQTNEKTRVKLFLENAHHIMSRHRYYKTVTVVVSLFSQKVITQPLKLARFLINKQ